MRPIAEGSWVPKSCTLPTVEQPVRVAEFDAFFAAGVRSVDRLGPHLLRLGLDPAPQTVARAGDLMARENECCSFFTFTLSVSAGSAQLDIEVPPTGAEILEAVAVRAESGSSA